PLRLLPGDECSLGDRDRGVPEPRVDEHVRDVYLRHLDIDHVDDRRSADELARPEWYPGDELFPVDPDHGARIPESGLPSRGDPHPAMRRIEEPAAVVVRGPSPRLVGDPHAL